MKKGTRASRLFWSLAVGFGLIVGLLLAFSIRPPAEAKTVDSRLEPGLVDHPGQSSPASADSSLDPESGTSTARSAPAPQRDDTPPPTLDASLNEDRSSRVSAPGHGLFSAQHSMRPSQTEPTLRVAPASASVLAVGASYDASSLSTGLVSQWPRQVLAAGLLGQQGYAVDLAYDAVWGYVSPGDVITVTGPDGAYGAAEADGVGFFWTPLWRPEGQPAEIVDGDTIEVFVNGSLDATVSPRAVTGQVDVLGDRVVGTVAGAGAGEPVTVTLGLWAFQPSLNGAPRATTTTDASGAFTATFPANDLGSEHYARVEYGAGSTTVVGTVYPHQVFNVDSFSGAYGYAEPGQTVTVTVYVAETDTVRWSAPTTAAEPHGNYSAWEEESIAFGDVVEVDLGAGTVITTLASSLSARMDVVNDRVTGVCPPNETVRVRAWNWRMGTYAETSATADGSGHYTATFAGHDLRASDSVYPAFADAEGDDVLLSTAPPSVGVYPDTGGIVGSGDVAHTAYTATLYHAPDDPYVHTGTTQLAYNSIGWHDFGVDIVPGDVVTLETATWSGSMTVADLEFGFDTANDELFGQADIAGWVTGWNQQWQGYQYPVQRQASVSVTAPAPFSAAFSGFDLRGGSQAQVSHHDANDFVTIHDQVVQHVQVSLPWGVGGVSPGAGEVVTASLYASDGSTLLAETSEDHDDDPWSFWLDFGGRRIEPGDWITVTGESGWTAGVQVPPLSLSVDPDTDLAWGQGPEARLFIEHYQEPSWDGHFLPGDEFAIDWAAFGRDVRKGDSVAVTYEAPDGNRVRRNVEWLSMRVNTRDDWVEGNLEAGHTLWLTVTESDGLTVKATAELQSQEIPWWGGQTGFSTDLDDPWDSSRPDIVEGDRVYLSADDGRDTSVRVGAITGDLDVDADTISGTIHASWFTDTLRGSCSVWEEGGPWREFDVDPDGGSYLCDFAGEWDLRPGHDVAVAYNEPDGDQVINVFRQPAPDVGIWKWNTGGYARPGGVVVYGIDTSNDGDATAENTTIVDQLPPSTSWAGDTSGVIPVQDPTGVITWNLGDVAGRSSDGFVVTLNVDPSVPTGTSEIGPNCAAITTTTPGDYNPGNNGPVCTDPVDVWDDEVDVGVDKWAQPDDPAPGEAFEYHLDVCNNRGAAVGPVWLTDTLPLSTTFVSWRSDFGDTTYWTEVVTTGGQAVLYAPGLPGNTCERLQLRLLLDPDAPIGTTLENVVEIATPDDVDPENDTDIDTDARVSAPRHDMRVDKSYNNGVLVPGGWIEYGVNYRNEGNAAIHAWLTDTLPAGTSFDSAWTWDGGEPVEPISDPLDPVVWDLGVVGVNEESGFNVRLDIDEGVTPGTALNNCATVGITATEGTPWNNVDCAAGTVYAAGYPNLYVTKQVDDYEPGWESAQYSIRFGNYGDQPVDDVHLTDTLPISTSLDGYDVDWWGDGPFTDTASPGQLQVVFERIEPGWGGEIRLSARLDDPSARLRGYTNKVEIDIPFDDANPADNAAQAVAFSGGEVDWVDINVHDNTLSYCAYSAPVTITTAYTEKVVPWECSDEWFEDPFEPADVVTVSAGAATHPVVIEIPDPFIARASSITDTVWGQIDALDHELVNVDLDDGPSIDVQTDGSGSYSATFSDVPRGGRGWVNWETMVNYAEVDFHRAFQSPDLLITVDYGDDYVQGDYEPGHTVWLTLTESDGTTTKATSQLTTGPMPDWGGDSGFVADGEEWVPQYPDIQAGDWVSGLVESAVHTTTVRVGAIDGEVDVDADTISGTIDAAWLEDAVLVRCEIHEENGPDGIEVPGVDPDGGSFFCDFDGAWDIEPGTNVAVNYTEPDGDRVQTHPPNPAPDLSIDKNGSGYPTPGGNYVYRINYHNYGGMAASGVVITDVLPAGMSYITDTLGIPHTGTGNGPIVWELGQVDSGVDSFFDVFVSVAPDVEAGTRVTNVVEIATPDIEPNTGNNHHEWSTEVTSNDTYLNVGKWAWTPDPAPDSDFVYAVNVCNNGSTGSTGVVLTDTLHPSMTFQSWWGQHAGWTLESSGSDQLVVSSPSMPGWWCSEVYMVVHLSENAWPGMPISNTAVISASNDLDGNNEVVWWGNVSDLYTDLRVDKWWGGGQLVPGGQIRFHGEYRNEGNVPVSGVLITETLPANTSLLEWWQYDQNWNPIGPVNATFIAPNRYVWEVGDVANGYAGNYEIVLQIDSDADPGTVLTNTIAISPQPDEYDRDDNVDSEVEMVYGHGPNLRLRKEGWWDDQGENTRRASYNLSIENVGDAPVAPVVITDTHDAKMALDGGVGVDYGGWWDWADDPAHHTFTVTLESLQGGDGATISFGTITETEPLPDGLVFTNTAAVTRHPDDTNPPDNVDELVLTTGPDLYVEKELVAGDLLPGELITFSLRFGNDRPGHEWWWNMEGTAWLTDTLPDGLDYITSTLHWCEDSEWCPMPAAVDGDDYTWELWSLSTGGWNEIQLTARITDTATGLDRFTNQVEIASDQPVSDTEPTYGNNRDAYHVPIALPTFVVEKGYESSRVGGTLITYRLTVDNPGNEPGTSVILSDTVPAGLSDIATDGYYDGTDVTWQFDTIAAEGGEATGWFNGILPCSGTVTNDAYRVVGSGEGVTSSPGAPLVVDVVPPALDASFDRSATAAVVGTTFGFTDTSTTDGAPIVAWEWDFGDGGTGSGETVSHAYLKDGTFTVQLTVTDTCGYTDVRMRPVTVNVPDLVADFEYGPDPAYVLVGDTVVFTDTSTTDGPAIVAWEWDFGDGSAHAVTENPAHAYTTVGTYTVGLVVTDTLGYSDQAIKTDVVVVSSRCTELTGVTFTYAPADPLVKSPVVYTATHTPLDATAPISYTWDYGDGTTATLTTPSAEHTYADSGAYDVAVTAYNPCTPGGVTHSERLTVAPRRIFLPLVVRNE